MSEYVYDKINDLVRVENPQHVGLDEITKLIEDSPNGYHISPDGTMAFILSPRPSEVFVVFETPDGVEFGFHDMDNEEILEHMRAKLKEIGFDIPIGKDEN